MAEQEKKLFFSKTYKRLEHLSDITSLRFVHFKCIMLDIDNIKYILKYKYIKLNI